MDPRQQNELARLLTEQNSAMAALITKLKEENQQLEGQLQRAEAESRLMKATEKSTREACKSMLEDLERKQQESIAVLEEKVCTIRSEAQGEKKRRQKVESSASRYQMQQTNLSLGRQLMIVRVQKEHGLLKAILSTRFFDELGLNRQCGHCLCACSVKLSYCKWGIMTS
jgi:hypothetical protein